MTYYLLPKTNIFSYKYIDFVEDTSLSFPVISFSHNIYIQELKERIGFIEKDWDIFKKYTNPYEYIHTNIPFEKKCVSSYVPLSRSYFKMIEMLHTFQLHLSSKPIQSFHLAEGPGGFIEALSNIRHSKEDIYYGMTILNDSNDPNVPGWKKIKHFLQKHKNVNLEYGVDNTGDILNIDNFVYIKEKYGSSMDVVTGDGGFDFSSDFNQQETSISKLLFAQVVYALCLQKEGGTFILKIFDSFMQHTIDLLYILSSFYEKTYIMKPHTSRYANSEKYIVCKGFYYSCCDKFFPYLHRAFEKMVNPSNTEKPLYPYRFLTLPICNYFTTKLEEYNAVFGQQQIENIHYTLLLIENKHKQDKIDILIKNNIEKCKRWCNKYNVPIHSQLQDE
jgi:23S rRNA U2552 (ribose-2'-O)-methylase RlmE/FtsJ